MFLSLHLTDAPAQTSAIGVAIAHRVFDAAAAVAVETTAVAREGDVVEEAVHHSSVCCNHPPNRAWRDHCTWFDALDGSSSSQPFTLAQANRC